MPQYVNQWAVCNNLDWSISGLVSVVHWNYRFCFQISTPRQMNQLYPHFCVSTGVFMIYSGQFIEPESDSLSLSLCACKRERERERERERIVHCLQTCTTLIEVLHRMPYLPHKAPEDDTEELLSQVTL